MRRNLHRRAREALRHSDYRLALEAAEERLRCSPADEFALFARCAALWQLGRQSEARAAIETGLSRNEGRALRAAVLFYASIGNVQRTIALVDQGNPADARLLVQASRWMASAGRLSGAREVLRRACSLDPSNQQAQKRLELIQSRLSVLTGAWRPPRIKPQPLKSIPGRVLHMLTSSLPAKQDGYTLRSHNVATAQRAAGIDAHAVTRLGFPDAEGFERTPPHERIDGVPYHRLRATSSLPKRDDERLRLNLHLADALVRELRPAVLHPSSDYKNALIAVELRRRFGLPLVYEVRGFWEDTWLARRRLSDSDSEYYHLWREMELRCMLDADRVVTLGQEMKRQIVERGVPGEKITVVPNAVDTNVFRPIPRDGSLARRLGIGPQTLVVGYVTSIEHYEGIEYLIEALGQLAAKGRDVHGLIVGGGRQSVRDSLQRLTSELNLSKRITFAGRVPHTEVLRYYGLIDIFVVPRKGDRVSRSVVPLKPLEAMATGRATIVSNIPALRELVSDGQTGLVFEAENATSLTTRIESLLDDAELRSRLGADAREWVRTNRTWCQNGSAYRDLYAELGSALG